MTQPVLTVRGVGLVRGERRILSGATFDADREVVAIMGPSGSGKTTAPRCRPRAVSIGQIAVDDVVLETRWSGKRSGRSAARSGWSSVPCLFEHLSALDNVWLAPIHAHRIAPGEARRGGIELLKAFGVDHRAHALPRNLSGGEAQRVAIARALAVNPPILLMDEPTASLDPVRRGELGELIRGLTREGRTIVIATHDEEFARTWATRRLRLESGAVVQDGVQRLTSRD